MNVHGKHYSTIWLHEDDPAIIRIIDQRWLPHRFIIEDLHTVNEVVNAIKEMHVRGAGLIGATAGFGMYLAALEGAKEKDFNAHITASALSLKLARPTAVNPQFAVNKQLQAIEKGNCMEEKIAIAQQT